MTHPETTLFSPKFSTDGDLAARESARPDPTQLNKNDKILICHRY